MHLSCHMSWYFSSHLFVYIFVSERFQFSKHCTQLLDSFSSNRADRHLWWIRRHLASSNSIMSRRLSASIFGQILSNDSPSFTHVSLGNTCRKCHSSFCLCILCVYVCMCVCVGIYVLVFFAILKVQTHDRWVLYTLFRS